MTNEEKKTEGGDNSGLVEAYSEASNLVDTPVIKKKRLEEMNEDEYMEEWKINRATME